MSEKHKIGHMDEDQLPLVKWLMERHRSQGPITEAELRFMEWKGRLSEKRQDEAQK